MKRKKEICNLSTMWDQDHRVIHGRKSKAAGHIMDYKRNNIVTIPG